MRCNIGTKEHLTALTYKIIIKSINRSIKAGASSLRRHPAFSNEGSEHVNYVTHGTTLYKYHTHTPIKYSPYYAQPA